MKFLDEVIKAATEARKLKLTYLKASGECSERIVLPYSIKTTLDGAVILYAQNDDGGADEIRSFRVDRIATATVLDECFTPHPSWKILGHAR